MTRSRPDAPGFAVSDLSTKSPTRFEITPDAPARAALANDLGIEGIRKLRFSGEIRADGKRDWRLDGRLGATVVQACVVTLAPVTTRIDQDVSRRFLAEMPDLKLDESGEAEMPEDDTIEPLTAEIDPATVMAEALALALPLYPRADGAELGVANFAEPGVKPLSDEAAKPFAGLAELRDKLGKSGSEDSSD
ncbi:YceD family protein [Nioella aestuarii]|uniref:YceD family protein n=1 Tax=Nioella aestuarii TaxID=1662864 RepID=UPI003D7FA148